MQLSALETGLLAKEHLRSISCLAKAQEHPFREADSVIRDLKLKQWDS
jgi:hypothetical protein